MSVNPDTAILDADVIMCNEATNKISITDIKDTGIDIKFDYMEPRNGCVLQIMYTGKKEDLEVTLKIKGGHIKKIDTELTKQKFEREMEKKMLVLAVINFTILILVQVFPWNLFGIVMERSINSIMLDVLVLVFFGVIIYGSFFGPITKKKDEFNGIPASFKDFI